MTIELIPVLEIGYINQGIPPPDKYPYWDYPDLWDKYHSDSYAIAGFKDKLQPYLPGSSFYRLPDISDNNLIKLTKDHTEDLRLNKYNRQLASAFFGGYVLRIDNQDKYFPQCCGDLSDIQYWDKLATENRKIFYQGHPEPIVKFDKGVIVFDFAVEELDEHFSPTPPDKKISIDSSSLKNAIVITKNELISFSNRLKQINASEHLNIDNIDNLLVWGDD